MIERITPLERHGSLFVDGINIIDKNKKTIQLYGISTYGMHRPEYLTEETFTTLRDDWNTNCVRVTIYTQAPYGYCGDNKEEHKKNAITAIDAAIALGMYVIVDWHVLGEKNPLIYIDEAASFFDEISSRYAKSPNLIYEICNEPNGDEGCWDNICEYANTIIPIIRKNSPASIILVGTPVWSQEVNRALEAPLEYDNIMYTFHFYAGTHKEELRNRVKACLEGGLPIFVSEFNICTCTGNGDLEYEEGEKWKELIENFNVSFICWNLSNTDESSSILKKTTLSTSGWTDDELNDSGLWMKKWCLEK